MKVQTSLNTLLSLADTPVLTLFLAATPVLALSLAAAKVASGF